MRRTYQLRTWRGWDRHLDACVRDFSAEFGTRPNLLVASGATLRRLNVAANHARVSAARGRRAADRRAYLELAGIAAEDCELLFVEEAEVPDNSFALIHALADDELEQAAML